MKAHVNFFGLFSIYTKCDEPTYNHIFTEGKEIKGKTKRSSLHSDFAHDGRRFKVQTKPGSMMELCSLVWFGEVGVPKK